MECKHPIVPRLPSRNKTISVKDQAKVGIKEAIARRCSVENVLLKIS